MAEQLPVPDDPTIEPDDLVYRRVRDGGNINVVLNADGERVASSAAFEDDADGISVFLRSTLVSAGLGPGDVIDGFAGYVVATLLVKTVRDLGVGVHRDPNPAVARPMPCDVAHCLLKVPQLSRTQNHKLRQRIAAAAVLVE